MVHELFLTMIDGKVCQALTLTSSPSNCVICGAKPSEMNNLSAKRKEKKENFQYVYNFNTSCMDTLYGTYFTFSISFTFSQMVSSKL